MELSKKQEKLQKYNNKIMNTITKPFKPSELQEIAEMEGWN